jgi:hypothetical protein
MGKKYKHMALSQREKFGALTQRKDKANKAQMQHKRSANAELGQL